MALAYATEVKMSAGRGEGQPHVDKSVQGEDVKISYFCGHPLWMIPCCFYPNLLLMSL